MRPLRWMPFFALLWSGCVPAPKGACVTHYEGESFCDDYTENICESIDEDGDTTFHLDESCNDLGYTEHCGSSYETWWMPSSIVCEDA